MTPAVTSVLPQAPTPMPQSGRRPISSLRYLVTGGDGFIGRHLLRRLAAAGAEVHARTRSEQEHQGETVWWMLDLRDGAATRHVTLLARPDVIIHLAVRATCAPAGDNNIIPALTENVLGTIHVINAANELPGCRVVLVDSAEDDALLAAAVKPHANATTVTIGTGESRPVREIVSLVADALGARIPLRFPNVADSRDVDLTVDPSSALTHLNWAAAVDLPAGIDRTVAWYTARSGPRHLHACGKGRST